MLLKVKQPKSVSETLEFSDRKWNPESSYLLESTLVDKKKEHGTIIQRQGNNIVTYKKKYRPQETVDPRTAG